MLQFGTGGWRAVIADGFTKANLRLLAAGLCRLMDDEGLKGAERADSLIHAWQKLLKTIQ